MTIKKFEEELEALLNEEHNPAKNYAKEIAYLVRGYLGDKEDAFSIVAAKVDYGFFNMIIDEYNFYFKEWTAVA